MINFKACPRCQGDIESNWDMYGRFLECLQCGYMYDMEKTAAFKLEAVLLTEKRAKTEAAREMAEKYDTSLERSDFPPGNSGYYQYYYWSRTKGRREAEKNAKAT